MKIIENIKLHRTLRIKQELLCNDVVMWSQRLVVDKNGNYIKCPDLEEFSSVNKQVKEIEKKLPKLYFILSDIFGGCSSLRKKSKEEIKKHNKYGINQE